MLVFPLDLCLSVRIPMSPPAKKPTSRKQKVSKTEKKFRIYSRVIGGSQLKKEILSMAEETFKHPQLQQTVLKIMQNAKKYRMRIYDTQTTCGNGVKCEVDIPPNTPIAGYPGYLLEEPDRYGDRLPKQSTYDLALGVVSPDGSDVNACKLNVRGRRSKKPYNGAMFNHDCKPNCYFETIELQGVRKNKHPLPFVVIKTDQGGLKAGEQATLDYGDGFWTPVSKLKPTPGTRILECACGKCPFAKGVLVAD